MCESGSCRILNNRFIRPNQAGVYRWVSACENGGKTAIKSGRKCRLNDSQEILLMKLTCDGISGQMKYPFVPWNRQPMQQVIDDLLMAHQAGASHHYRLYETLGNYTQEPASAAYRRNPEAVKNG